VKKLFLLFVFCIAPMALAQHADVQPLLSKDLSGIPGKEGLMVKVTFPPGHSDGLHRHDAHVFVYVLEGSVIMQLKGKPSVTLHAGDTFYEAPDDIHLEGKNASATSPATFIAFFVKDKGAPVVKPIN